MLTPFQSTRPVRGATHGLPQLHHDGIISIHAPRAGRDTGQQGTQTGEKHFNPRAPCGARLVRPIIRKVALVISIHAPRAGRDASRIALSSSLANFNPRAPCGARQVFTE